MKRGVKLAVACVAMLVATAGQLKASLIITYQDIGSDLRFDYSGSLGVAANGNTFQTFATVSNQSGSPVFYSTGGSGGYGYAGTSSALTQTPGPFATNLPAFAPVQGTTTGTSFMFRLNGGIPGPASSMDIWGDWGAANSPIVGQLIITDQSAASLGLVDGWQVTTEWGSITFTAIPEPSSLALCGIGACFACLAATRRRRPEKQL